MKAIVKIVLMVLFLLNAGISAKAQDVDGISLWDKCTKEQLIEKYGEPTDYYSEMDDEVCCGLIEEFVFKELHIRLEANRVVEFGLHGNKPKAMTKLTKGGIGLGDPAEVIEKLADNLVYKKEGEDGIIMYKYCYLDNLLNIGVKDGKIVILFATATTT